jgi:hypothetical protein
MRVVTVFLAITSLAGCVSVPQPPTVVYQDRNRDGRVDYEMHHPNGKRFDALEWAYFDDNFDGYYDRKMEYGELVGIVDHVHIPVPKVQFHDTPRHPSPSPTPRKKA